MKNHRINPIEIMIRPVNLWVVGFDANRRLILQADQQQTDAKWIKETKKEI